MCASSSAKGRSVRVGKRVRLIHKRSGRRGYGSRAPDETGIDASVPAEVAALFDKAEESFGGIDIIVNNAGIMQQGLVSVADTDDALFDRLFAINVKGTFNTLRLAAKRLRQGGRGGIVTDLLPNFGPQSA